MGWWDTLENGVETFGNKVVAGLSWTWNNASLSRVTKGLVTYVANTSFGILKQGLALEQAIPSLYNNPKSWKIVKGMSHVVLDAVPLLFLNVMNAKAQGYFRSDTEKDLSWFTAYSVFLSGLTLVNYGVKAYTWRQGVQSLIRVSILDSLGPVAFTTQKESIPSLCVEEQCTNARKAKGWLKEPFILLGNELLTNSVKNIPYIGEPSSQVLRVLFNGRYIARQASPEFCERHKVQAIMHEYLLGLGLTFELSSQLMDYVLHHTVGMPPYLYHRTLRHLLLLLHVNVAAHMTLPLLKANEATLPFDPLNFFENTSRFVMDVFSYGLKTAVPMYVKFDEDAEPFIPLSVALQKSTSVLNYDLVQKNGKEKSHYQPSSAMLWMIAPPILQGMDNFIRDPIITLYWFDLANKVTDYVDGVLTVGSYVSKYRVTKYPGLTSFALNYYKSIPDDWTETALMLCKEQDFWDFIHALKGWLARHGLKSEVKFSKEPVIYLHGEQRPEPLLLLNKGADPSLSGANTTTHPSVIEVKKPQKSPISPISPTTIASKREHLMKVELSDFKSKNNKKNALVSTNPVALFSKKQTKKDSSFESVSLQNKG